MGLKSWLNTILKVLGFAKDQGWIDKGHGPVRNPDNSKPPGQ